MAYTITAGRTLVGVALGADQAQGSAGVATTALGAYGNWMGRPVEVATDFIGINLTASDFSSRLSAYQGWTGVMVWSMAPFPQGSTYDAAIAGTHDALYDAGARAIMTAGFNDNCVIRIAWELSTANHHWGAALAATNGYTHAKFKQAFDRIANRFKALGFRGKFEFNSERYNGFQPELATPATADFYGTDLFAVYGATSYASGYNQDAYDGAAYNLGATSPDVKTAWANEHKPQLDQLVALALRDGKRPVLSEFSTGFRTDGSGCGDDDYFLAQLATYLPVNDFAYATAYNDNDLVFGGYDRSAYGGTPFSLTSTGVLSNRWQLATPGNVANGTFTDSTYFPRALVVWKSVAWRQAAMTRTPVIDTPLAGSVGTTVGLAATLLVAVPGKNTLAGSVSLATAMSGRLAVTQPGTDGYNQNPYDQDGYNQGSTTPAGGGYNQDTYNGAGYNQGSSTVTGGYNQDPYNLDGYDLGSTTPVGVGYNQDPYNLDPYDAGISNPVALTGGLETVIDVRGTAAVSSLIQLAASLGLSISLTGALGVTVPQGNGGYTIGGFDRNPFSFTPFNAGGQTNTAGTLIVDTSVTAGEAVTVSLGGVAASTPVQITVAGQLVGSAVTDAQGRLVGTLIIIPLSLPTGLPTGQATLVASGPGINLSAILSVTAASDAALRPAAGVRRWTFTDSQGRYTFERNPQRMDSPNLGNTTNALVGGLPGTAVAVRAHRQPKAWTFSGVIRTRSEHDALVDWAKRHKGRILVTDHLGRMFEVLLVQFETTDKQPTLKNDWRLDYTMHCLLLGALRGGGDENVPAPPKRTTSLISALFGAKF